MLSEAAKNCAPPCAPPLPPTPTIAASCPSLFLWNSSSTSSTSPLSSCLPSFRLLTRKGCLTIFPSYHHSSALRAPPEEVLGPFPCLFSLKILRSFPWLLFAKVLGPFPGCLFLPLTLSAQLRLLFRVTLLLATAVAAAAEVTEISSACICFHLHFWVKMNSSPVALTCPSPWWQQRIKTGSSRAAFVATRRWQSKFTTR